MLVDIEENLKTALVSVEEELARVEARLATLRERKATLTSWIAEEQPRSAQSELPVIPSASPASMKLGDFVRAILGDGTPRTTVELAGIAAQKGLIREKVSPARALHFALVGLEHHGHVEKDRQGRWHLKH